MMTGRVGAEDVAVWGFHQPLQIPGDAMLLQRRASTSNGNCQTTPTAFTSPMESINQTGSEAVNVAGRRSHHPNGRVTNAGCRELFIHPSCTNSIYASRAWLAIYVLL